MKYLISILSILSIVCLAGCHSSPKSVLNDEASLRSIDRLPENPFLLTPLTSSINVNDSTMSTLYGNDHATMHLKNAVDSLYSDGSVLYEITWKQQPDSVWFGGNIPKEIYSVERISFQNKGVPDYEFYSGNPLQKLISNDSTKRIEFIISQQIAVSP